MDDDKTMAALYSALAAAQAAIKGIHHDKRNAHHGYDYASAEGMLRECRTVLVEHGLALIPTGFAIDGGDNPATTAAKGAGIARRSFLLAHIEGGSLTLTQDWPIVPGGGRPLDKATAAADTASLGYLMRNLLLLPRVEKGTELDDEERDREAEKEAKKKEKKPKPADDAKRKPSRSEIVAFLDVAPKAPDLRKHFAKVDEWDLDDGQRDLMAVAYKAQANIHAGREPVYGFGDDQRGDMDKILKLAPGYLDNRREAA